MGKDKKELHKSFIPFSNCFFLGSVFAWLLELFNTFQGFSVISSDSLCLLFGVLLGQECLELHTLPFGRCHSLYSFLNDSFTRYRILCWQTFFFEHFEYGILYFLSSIHSEEESFVNLTEVSCK